MTILEVSMSTDLPALPELLETARLPVDRHPAAVYLARLAPGSRPAQTGALDAIADVATGGRASARDPDAPRRALAWHALRYQHTQAVRTALAERYAPATANRMLAALRGVLREAWRLGLMNAEDFHRAADLPAVRGSTLPRGRAITSGELRAMFQAIAADRRAAVRARDAALLALLYAGGLRRAEVVALDVANYDAAAGALRVRGKGRKERLLYATNGAQDALAAWLEVRGPDAGPLFLPV